jgi:N-acetylneuraminic acid mutarotase
MLTARSGFGVATYENQIYAIGGETGQAVTGLTERYNPADNQWSVLAAKPVAVSDIGAAVVGGRIYAPGGRLASGAVTTTVEMYDPREDRWAPRAPLPVALSAYALVAFEGRLYLFGGWDGQSYQAGVYVYDPSRDTWTSHTPMPTARGFAGAAAAGGKIYVVGGTDGQQVVNVNEEYGPAAEVNGEPAWQARAALPEGRSGVALASLADTLYLVGGEGGPSLEYFPEHDQWQPFDAPFNQAWAKPGLAGVGTNLYAFGGLRDGTVTAEHLTYQALFTIVLPVINSGSP